MATRRDAIGNLIGRLGDSERRTLLIGSHLDTVPDAGRYDGMLGVLVAIGRVVKERWAATTVDAVSRARTWQPSAAAARAGAGLGVVFDPVPAGGTTTTRVSIVNDGAIPAAMTLRCTDLSGGGVGRIPATAVTVEPRQVDVPPKGAVAVVLTIAVPSGTRPGLYAGVLQELGNPAVRTTVGVEVR